MKIFQGRKSTSSAFIIFYLMCCSTLTQAQENFTNTNILYISNGTTVSSVGSFTTTASGNTQNEGDFYLKGDWTNDGTYTSNSGNVIYWGSNSQAINGNSVTDYYDMDINKSSNGVTMNKDVNVADILTLDDGTLDLNSNKLTIKNSFSSGIGYTNGMILSEDSDNTSRVQWNIGSAMGAHVIPFGTVNSELIPLTLNLTSGTIGNLTASTFPTAADNTPYPIWPDLVLHVRDKYGNDNSANMVDRFWQIDRTGVDGVLTATFTYADAEAPTTGEAGLEAQRYGTMYNGWDQAVPLQTSNALLNTVTTPGITTFGPYALSQSTDPLPLELILFKANPDKQKNVVVTWVTASEQNTAFFTVERSKDAVNFESIEKVKAAGTSTSNRYYKTLDSKLYEGISYYRLKQTDYNGRNTYSEIQQVNLEKDQTSSSYIFPSPATSAACFYSDNSWTGILRLTLTDAAGKLVAFKTYEKTDSKIITIERNNLAGDIYFVKAEDDNGLLYSGKVVFK